MKISISGVDFEIDLEHTASNSPDPKTTVTLSKLISLLQEVYRQGVTDTLRQNQSNPWSQWGPGAGTTITCNDNTLIPKNGDTCTITYGGPGVGETVVTLNTTELNQKEIGYGG